MKTRKKKKLTATQSEEYFFDQRILRKDVTKSGNGEPGTGVWERVFSGNPL